MLAVVFGPVEVGQIVGLAAVVVGLDSISTVPQV